MRFLLNILLCLFVLLTYCFNSIKATEHIPQEFYNQLPIQIVNYINHLPTIKRDELETNSTYEKSAKIVNYLQEFYPQRQKSELCLQSLTGRETLVLKFQEYLENNQTINMDLCGFPFKSINTEKKVLDSTIDMAEFVSLLTLNHICCEISTIHAAGAKIHIISDGIIFKDILQISNHVFNNYQESLRKLISLFPQHIELITPSKTCFEDFKKKLIIQEELSNKEQSLDVALEREALAKDFEIFARHELECEEGRLKQNLTAKSLAKSLLTESTYFAKYREKYLQNYTSFIHLSVHPYTDISYRCSIDLFYKSSGTPWHLTPIFTDQTVLCDKLINEIRYFNKIHPPLKKVAGPSDSLIGKSGLENLAYIQYLKEKENYEQIFEQHVKTFEINGLSLKYFLR